MTDTIQWRAFYADGRRVTSAEMPWADLPRDGLVVAVWWDERGTRHLECGDDALVMAGETIVGVNLPTPAFQWAADTEAHHGCLKFGQYMDPAAWAAVRAEADAARTPPDA